MQCDVSVTEKLVMALLSCGYNVEMPKPVLLEQDFKQCLYLQGEMNPPLQCLVRF